MKDEAQFRTNRSRWWSHLPSLSSDQTPQHPGLSWAPHKWWKMVKGSQYELAATPVPVAGMAVSLQRLEYKQYPQRWQPSPFTPEREVARAPRTRMPSESCISTPPQVHFILGSLYIVLLGETICYLVGQFVLWDILLDIVFYALDYEYVLWPWVSCLTSLILSFFICKWRQPSLLHIVSVKHNNVWRACCILPSM